jgi:hypothetical protein
MTPARRLTLKRSTGWLAAGQEMAAALDLLSDAAFKLYVYLCLNVDRHSGRMIWEALDLANRLQRDRESMALALEELCRLQVCIQHPAADGRIARERLSLEICDGFWPYEKAPVQEFGIDQNRYVQQVRQMMLRPVCVRAHFSAADERIAVALYRRGITLVHLQRAIWLGCARKYAALLNGSEKQARCTSPACTTSPESCRRSKPFRWEWITGSTLQPKWTGLNRCGLNSLCWRTLRQKVKGEKRNNAESAPAFL